MLTFIVIFILVYVLLRILIIESRFWAVVWALVFMSLFVTIDGENQEARFKTQDEINTSIDGARDVAIDGVEKAGEASADIKEAFENGKKKD